MCSDDITRPRMPFGVSVDEAQVRDFRGVARTGPASFLRTSSPRRPTSVTVATVRANSATRRCSRALPRARSSRMRVVPVRPRGRLASLRLPVPAGASTRTAWQPALPQRPPQLSADEANEESLAGELTHPIRRGDRSMPGQPRGALPAARAGQASVVPAGPAGAPAPSPCRWRTRPSAMRPATSVHRLSTGAHKLPVSPPRPPSDHLHRYELLLPPEPPLRRRNWMMISGSEVGLSS